MRLTRRLLWVMLIVAWINVGCTNSPAQVSNTAFIPTNMSRTIEISRDSLVTKSGEGRVYFGSIPFTGYAVQRYAHGQLAEKTSYVGGKKEGLSEKWYPTGAISFRGMYAGNHRHGAVKTWWKNGTLRAASNYIEGTPHGVQRQWYQSGAPFKELNLKNGKEEGLQRAWRENGKLYANYESVNGRIFGLKRANLCYDLDGELINLSVQP